jgi:predicted component of type VI protein secretion system
LIFLKDARDKDSKNDNLKNVDRNLEKTPAHYESRLTHGRPTLSQSFQATLKTLEKCKKKLLFIKVT